MREKKGFGNLKLLNPRNLAREVHVYGYHFSWKMHTLTIVCSLLGISAIGVLFKLKPLFFGITVLITAGLLPVFILNMYKGMFEQKRFADAVTYGEQMLYSFQKSRKVLSALKETKELFEDGRMRYLIEEAIAYLESGYVSKEGDLLRNALNQIEKEYACVKIRTIHELLINSEKHGGEVQKSILLLLDDIELWKRRGYLLQNKKKSSNRDNIISIAVATMLCATALYVLNGMGNLFPGINGTDIFLVDVIQVSSFVFLILMLYVLLKSMKRLNQDWLQEDEVHSDSYHMAGYDRVMNYDEDGGRRRQMIIACLCLTVAVLAFGMGKVWISICCIIMTVLVLGWNRITYNLAKRDVRQELYLALPQWLMEIALLLQNNNVQISLMKSAEKTHPILKRELELLQIRLLEQPHSLQSYTDFCRNFDVPEAQSCMKMLHAISESGTGDVMVQIHHLIERVHQMQNMADNLRDSQLAFRMKMLFSYPVLAATGKLMFDLTIGMIFMLQMIGSIGGVG